MGPFGKYLPFSCHTMGMAMLQISCHAVSFLTELILILAGIVSFDSILVLTHPDTLIFFSHLYSYIEN